MPDESRPKRRTPIIRPDHTETHNTEPVSYVAAPEDSEFIEIDPDARPGDHRPSVLRTAGRVSARVVIGAIVAALVILVMAAAATVPIPRPAARQAGASETVTPVPSARQLVCPGGLLRLATASGKGATTPSALGKASITSAASSGHIERKAFSTSDAGTAGRSTAPQLLSTPPAPTGSTAQAFVSGAQSQTVGNAEFSGLASAACTAASSDVWLTGGSTSVGRTTLLLLSNPSDVLATVSIHIYGENGPVTAPGTDGIIVAPLGQRVLSLAGYAPDLASPVVHVQSSGGEVVANLEQSTVRGVTPGGIDFAGGSPGVLRTTVIPGVVVTGTDAVQSQLGQAGFDDLQTTLRIYLPGTKSTKASISVVSETGGTTGKALTADLEPGKVTDLTLDGVTNGSYTVRVTTRAPVAASVRVSTAGSSAVDAGTDFAWLTPAPLLTSSALVSIAGGMTSAIHLDNPTKSSETVSLTAVGGGDDLSATVPAGTAVTLPVNGGTTYRLSGFSGLYAAVSGTTDGGITGYVVSPSEAGSGPIKIYG